MAKTKIADISRYQGEIDWAKAATELAFCILRASVGTNLDTKYTVNAAGCKANGIPFHAYHYLKATTTTEAITEAQHFYKAASPAEPLFYVADVEYGDIPAGSARAIVSAFIQELKRLGAKRMAIYVGHHLYKKFNLDIGEVDYVWIPRYGKNSGQPETQPDYLCDIWQYTSNGTLAGVAGRVDLSRLMGTKPLTYFTDNSAQTQPAKEPENEPEKGENEMTYDPKKVIAVAEAEVGYLEKASNSNLDSKTGNAGSKNYTKYARDMDAIPDFYNGKKQGVAWCDIFVDWCFVQAYGVEAARMLLCQPAKSTGAGCQYSRAFYKAKGQLHDTPQPGDQIFFWPADRSDPNDVAHTGLVYAVDKTYVYTIEGNTSGASGVVANGGGVQKKKYALNYARIAGYGRPAYGMQATTPAPTTPTTPARKLGSRILRNGDQGEDVKELQTKLKGLGYFSGTIGGNYLSLTTKAVKAFQKAQGLKVDGEFGPKSYAALVTALGTTAPPEPAPAQPDPEPPASEPVYTLTIQGTKAALEAIQAQYGGTLAAADPEE